MGTHLYPHSTRQYSHTCTKCLQSATNSIHTHLCVHTLPETVSTHIYIHTVLQTAISTHISSSLSTQYHKPYPHSTTNSIRTHLPRHPHSTTYIEHSHLSFASKPRIAPCGWQNVKIVLSPQKKGTSALLSFHTHSAYLKVASVQNTEGHCNTTNNDRPESQWNTTDKTQPHATQSFRLSSSSYVCWEKGEVYAQDANCVIVSCQGRCVLKRDMWSVTTSRRALTHTAVGLWHTILLIPGELKLQTLAA